MAHDARLARINALVAELHASYTSHSRRARARRKVITAELVTLFIPPHSRAQPGTTAGSRTPLRGSPL